MDELLVERGVSVLFLGLLCLVAEVECAAPLMVWMISRLLRASLEGPSLAACIW